MVNIYTRIAAFIYFLLDTDPGRVQELLSFSGHTDGKKWENREKEEGENNLCVGMFMCWERE